MESDAYEPIIQVAQVGFKWSNSLFGIFSKIHLIYLLGLAILVWVSYIWLGIWTPI